MNVLREMAARAEAQPQPVRRGRYEYIHTEARHRTTRSQLGRDGTLTVTSSEMLPVVREFWIAPDGSGRIAETRDGEPSPANGYYVPGRLTYFDLPTDPAELEIALPVRGPAEETSTWFDAVRRTWASRVVEPGLRSALLRVLSTKPGVAEQGTVVDAKGRPGTAFTTERGDKRHRLIIDPATGWLNEARVIEPRDDASGFTVFLSASYVEDPHGGA